MIKRYFLCIVVALATMGATLALPVGAVAQGAPTMAVVDVNVIMREASAAKGLRTQMQKQFEGFQKWGKGQEDKFRSEGEALRKQQAVLAQDVLRKRQQDLEKKVNDFQVEARKREAKIRQAGANAQRELDKVLVAVVGDVAKKAGVSMVLPKSVMIYSGDVRDITEETLAQLNKKLPKLAIKIPK
ncbi:MAG: OmpH family outer membrane protein [Alphaproteobacteria bacterium]|nr:OmpH family outer membrane protein [Alphaproteobacteria bacterium]